jgi:hypoxanthine phosphoribosyltransferase
MPAGYKNEYVGQNEEANFVFKEIIQPAVKQVFDFEDDDIKRQVDDNITGAIDKSIVRNIAHAEFVIVDITGLNPNVLFELGLRYVLHKKNTVIIKQESTIVPFDITSYKYLNYRPFYFGIEKARTDLIDILQNLKDTQSNLLTDSLVYDAIPNLVVKWDDSISTEDDKVMPWSIYWSQFNKILDILKKNHEYKPDLIFGLSSGGLWLADSIERNLYEDIPIVSLWRNRLAEDNDYFSNDINLGILQSLKQRFNNLSEIKILIADDTFSKGESYTKAKKLIEQSFVDQKIDSVFVTLFSRTKEKVTFKKLKNDLIFSNKMLQNNVDLTDDEIIKSCYTDFQMTPWKKTIRVSEK